MGRARTCAPWGKVILRQQPDAQGTDVFVTAPILGQNCKPHTHTTAQPSRIDLAQSSLEPPPSLGGLGERMASFLRCLYMLLGLAAADKEVSKIHVADRANACTNKEMGHLANYIDGRADKHVLV